MIKNISLDTDLGDDEVSIVERNVVEVNENVMLTQLGYLGLFIKLETVEAGLAGDGPLLRGCRCHDVAKSSAAEGADGRRQGRSFGYMEEAL